ncbi:MAG: aldehyde dehydrogenase family protein [Pyrinomonadaceae bacterium]|nr:aldehyde dehydrogenase family protein [Pyrinomonadaceae bacterium]
MELKRILIGGRFVTGNGLLRVTSPFTGDTVAEVGVAGESQIDEALTAGVAATEELRDLDPNELSRGLAKVSLEISGRIDDFAETIALESGKPLIYARIEAERAVATFGFAASEAKRFSEFEIPIDTSQAGDGRHAAASYHPKGLIFGITPFNFPLNLVAHKVAPALASRNSIIIKPSEKTPLSALMLGEAFLKSGLPESAFQVVPMELENIDEVLADSRVSMISFTGSDRVGWGIKRKHHKKPVALELGGNAPVIVDETSDLDTAATAIVGGAFAYSGQVCISVQRIIAHKEIEPLLTRKIKNLAESLQKGDPLDADTRISVMISKHAAEIAIESISEAVEDGAELVCGGKLEGSFVEPTLIRNPKQESTVVSEEIFAPVATIEPFEDFDEAIRMANSSRFGLQAGVFSKDEGRIRQASISLQYGGVVINDVPTFRIDNMPYGGIKDSGCGREGVRFAMEEMSDLKLVVTR